MKKLEQTFPNYGCLLRCIAMPLPHGGFRPMVEVTRYRDQKFLVAETFSRVPPFITSVEAIEYARAWSVEWVRSADYSLFLSF